MPGTVVPIDNEWDGVVAKKFVMRSGMLLEFPVNAANNETLLQRSRFTAVNPRVPFKTPQETCSDCKYLNFPAQ